MCELQILLDIAGFGFVGYHENAAVDDVGAAVFVIFVQSDRSLRSWPYFSDGVVSVFINRVEKVKTLECMVMANGTM